MDDSSSTHLYQYLPQALPIQCRPLEQAKTKFKFLLDNNDLNQNIAEQQTPLQQTREFKGKKRHQVGLSLLKLFDDKKYQSFEELILTPNNYTFCTINLKANQHDQVTNCEHSSKEKDEIEFESRFEGGNLALAGKVSTNKYYLALQRDTNSKATCQWFYFRTSNKNNKGLFTFQIVNLTKSYSAFENGMKPCILSKKQGGGWKRGGFNISYVRNSLPYMNYRSYYTLQFSYQFVHQDDEVFFAYCYPYTYSKLQMFLSEKQKDYSSIMKIKSLGKTIANNSIDIVTITNPTQVQKQVIFICGRVHPGETNGSYVCEGLISFLLNDSEEAENLRNSYIIKIVPMLNPDGVIHGNYRTSLVGVDLNRRWDKPDKNLHPQIFYFKKLITEVEYKKVLFIDLHGHSKKKSSFVYGCYSHQNPYLCKQLPYLLQKKAYCFSYENCNFSTPLYRSGTSRIALWKQFGIDHSYTFQTSFCGPMNNNIHFNILDFMKIGQYLGKTVSLYFCEKNSLKMKMMQNYLKQLYNDEQLLEHGQQISEGSESGEEEEYYCKSKELMKEEAVVSKKKLRIPKKYMEKEKQEKQSKQIFSRYLNYTASKWSKPRVRIQSKKQDDDQYLRHRQSIIPSKISVQKIQIGENQYHHQSFLGLGKSKLHDNSQKQKKSLESHSSADHHTFSSRYNKYKPYSFSKAIQKSELSLPKVNKNQYSKYKKYKKQQFSVNIQVSLQKKDNRNLKLQSKKQISLMERIRVKFVPSRTKVQWKPEK